MQRLIDADALLKELRKSCEYHAENSREFSLLQRDIIIVQEQPTVDAVPKEKILLFLNIANEELSKAHANKSANGIMTWSASVTTLEGLLKEYDTADTDIVPVIRCKDCKYNPKTSYTGCPMASISGRTENDYCSRAERKPPQVNPEMVREMKERLEK
jgi:hypothetical protein